MSHHLDCFIGHRFTQAYLDDFRNSVENAFEMYNGVIRADYADNTLVDGHILKDKIEPKISDSFFCIFDISEQDKPNVFIELGIAIGKKKRVVLTSRFAPPTDLAGYDTIVYDSFKELTNKLKSYLPQIIGDVLPNVAKPVGELPGEITTRIYQNHLKGKATLKSELLSINPNINDTLSLFCNVGILKEAGNSIIIPDNQLAFFQNMFRK
jgi:hypothetical protein